MKQQPFPHPNLTPALLSLHAIFPLFLSSPTHAASVLPCFCNTHSFQVGKLVALFFVVAFGSSMDIAAIQAEAPRDMDYNKELVTVGE